ncbi:MAG: hypothetical protein JXB07_21745 [Anaerolineae bacterium]|nr:hypothetical protein [Anaerolineae bacterium]
MPQHHIPTVVMVVCAAIPAGCVAGALPTPTASPTVEAAATASPSCDADAILCRVDKMLTDGGFDARYLTIDGRLVLSVRLSDPTLDPLASGDDMIANSRQVFRIGDCSQGHL